MSELRQWDEKEASHASPPSGQADPCPVPARCLYAQVLGLRKLRPYIPDFKLAFEHFCIHTGGRGVIDAIEKQLELSLANVAPSRETLFRYGNTSSSSIW